MPNENSLRNLKQFSSQYQPKKNGRKPSMLKKYLKKNTDLSMADQIKIFKEIIANHTYEDIRSIVFSKDGMDKEGNKVSALVWGFCMAWLADCKRGLGTGGIFAQMIDREYGKAVQPLELSGGLDIVQTMTPEEREKQIEELERRRNERKNNSGKM